MPAYDRTPTASQVMGSVLNTVDTVANVAIDAVKEQARSDLLFMQANFAKDQNDFLLKLQNSNDYENYQQYYDKFTKDILSSATNKDSNYYCRNQFTAKKMNEMLTSQFAELQNKVNNVVNTKRIQDAMVRDNETAKLNWETMSPEEALTANNAIKANQYAQGELTPEQYYNDVRLNLFKAGEVSIDNYYQANFQKALDNNLEAQAFWEEAINTDEFKNLSAKVISSAVANPDYVSEDGEYAFITLAKDSDAMKAYEKQFKQNYNASIAAMQEKNYTFLSQKFTEMVKTTDPMAKLSLCRQALNTIDSDMKGNRLDEAKRVSYTKLFEAYIDDITKAVSKGSGSGKESYATYATVIKNSPEQFMAGIKDGTFNYYDAAEALQDAAAETYYSTGGVWNETKTFKDDEERIEKYFLDNYSKLGVIEILNSKELLNAFNNEPSYKSVAAKYNNLKKDIEADLKIADPKKRKYGEDALGTLLSFAVDFVAESGNKVLTEDDLKTFDSMLNGVNLSWLDKNIKGFNNTSDKGILQTIDITQNNDFLFTDINGKDRWASPQAKEKMDQAAETLKPVLAEILGVNAKDLGDHSYMNTKYDKNNVPEWTIEGTRYHLEKTEDGKSYQAVDDKGNIYKGETIAEKRAADRKAKREAAAKKREMSAKDKKLFRDREKDFYGMTYDDFIETVNNSELSDEKKQQLLEEFATSDVWSSSGAWSKVLAFEDAGYYSK